MTITFAAVNYSPMLLRSCIAVIMAMWSAGSAAQGTTRGEVWGGYITSFKFADRWSMWNDFHYVPGAFWVNRHGLTYDFGDNGRLTAGYAYVLTATSASNRLVRDEHRPWGQYEIIKPMGPSRGWRARVRYDLRMRERVSGGEIVEGWIAYHRWRLMLSARQKLATYTNGHTLHIHLMNEILVNTGAEYFGSWLDQNRTYLMLSYDMPKVRVLFGPHVRALPGSGDVFNYRYGLTCWVIQRFDHRKYWPQP